MATAEPTLGQPSTFLESQAAPSAELAVQWRRLTRAATVVALLTSPALAVYFHEYSGWSWLWSILAALGCVIVARGVIDIGFRRVIPWPSLFGSDSEQLRGEDVVARRRAWFWRFWVRFGIFAGTLIVLAKLFLPPSTGQTLVSILPLLIIFPFYMLFNFAILFGPLLIMNLSQVRGFEPGDAEWGVRLADVRGQAEAKEEVRRVGSLWQWGEAVERTAVRPVVNRLPMRSASRCGSVTP
jgi:MFS family permease